jgi:nicotinamide-nucleotide amidase
MTSGDAAGASQAAAGVAQRAAGSAAGERELAAEIIGVLTERGQSAAVAESLTGGLLAAALTSIPGASAAFRGAVVAYAADLKAEVLGVPAGLLDRHGAVHPDVAAAMAAGVRRRMGATVGAATTGVAGPDPSDGQPVGTVYIAVSIGPGAVVPDTAGPGPARPGPARPGPAVRSLALAGSRDEIRRETVAQCLRLLLDRLLAVAVPGEEAAPGGGAARREESG